MRKKLVIALGGNALIQNNKDSIQDQQKVVQEVIKKIIPLHKTYDMVITHGNGPQVGNIAIRVEEAKGKAYQLPLDVCVAQSQGEIGYLIEQAIFNIAPKIHVIPVLTEVEVSAKDKAFSHPTKPIGPFYDSEEPVKNVPHIYIDKKGYRRVVPSPRPIHVFEASGIKHLIESRN